MSTPEQERAGEDAGSVVPFARAGRVPPVADPLVKSERPSSLLNLAPLAWPTSRERPTVATDGRLSVLHQPPTVEFLAPPQPPQGSSLCAGPEDFPYPEPAAHHWLAVQLGTTTVGGGGTGRHEMEYQVPDGRLHVVCLACRSYSRMFLTRLDDVDALPDALPTTIAVPRMSDADAEQLLVHVHGRWEVSVPHTSDTVDVMEARRWAALTASAADLADHRNSVEGR